MNEKDTTHYVCIPKKEYERLKFAEEKILAGTQYFIWEGCGGASKIYSIAENVMFEKVAKENAELYEQLVKTRHRVYMEISKPIWKRIFNIPA